MGSSSEKVARRPGAEMMWSSGVGSRMCNHKGSSLGTVAAALGPTMTRSVEARTACVRRACTRKEICCLPAGLQARRVPGRTQAGPKSSVQPTGGPRGARQSPIEHACLRQSPIEQDLHGCNAHECVQHPGASAHSWCERKTLKTVPYRFNAVRWREGARNQGVKAQSEKGLIPAQHRWQPPGPHTMLALSTECLEGEGH